MMEKSSGIYAIKNKLDGKLYIGQSKNISKRKTYHMQLLRRHKHFNAKLQNAFSKYGENNFEFCVLENCSPSSLNEKEIFYIEKYNAIKNGYNICVGGSGSTGRKCSESTKQKISLANSGKAQDELARKRISEAGKKLWSDPLYREKMSKIARPTSSWNAGRHHTPEEKKNLSEKLKGRTITDEHKQKLRELYKGEGSITAKLTEMQAAEIKLRCLMGERQCAVAKDYPVKSQSINDIVRGRRWVYLPNTIKELAELLGA